MQLHFHNIFLTSILYVNYRIFHKHLVRMKMHGFFLSLQKRFQPILFCIVSSLGRRQGWSKNGNTAQNVKGMPLSLQHGRIMTPSFQCCWAATVACPQVWIFKDNRMRMFALQFDPLTFVDLYLPQMFTFFRCSI